MRTFKTRGFARFARKEDIADPVLIDAVDRAERGLIDADLGGGVLKQRVARPGTGRSGGYRVLLFFRVGERAIFASGFAKNERDNINEAELAVLKQTAGEVLALSDGEVAKLIASGGWLELDRGEQET